MKLKKIRVLILMFVILQMFLLSSCRREESKKIYGSIDPSVLYNDNSIKNLDFDELHNAVLDEIMSSYNPFFFISNNSFDISGSNDPKKIVINFDCIKKTTKQDADLFLSFVLNDIGFEASNQNFKYKVPELDAENTYTTFGTVFNDYDLEIHATIDNKEVLYDLYIKAGDEIPIDPRYKMEVE